MKTKTTRRIFALLLACVMLMSTTVVFASAQSSQDGLSVAGSNSKASTYAYNTDTAIKPPSVDHNDTQYNMVVYYDWAVGTGGDKVALGYNWQYYTNMNAPTYREYAFTDYVGTDHCDPDYFLGKSYYSLTDTYSAAYTSLERDVPQSNGVTNVRYGYDAKYTCVGRFNYLSVNVGSTIPTSYDQTHYIWDHNAGNGDVIKATIEYNGSYADIEVKIPLLGYKTSSVTVGGQTFYLRTGPNRCSIKAANSGLNPAYLNFAFGIQNN